MMDLSELPSSAMLETMHWKLDSESLLLPATAVFTSLLDLSLESIVLPAGSRHLLARLQSYIDVLPVSTQAAAEEALAFRIE